MDRANRVCGDTAAMTSHAPEWAVPGTNDKSAGAVRQADLAIRAAQLLDRRLGRTCRAYGFSAFATSDADGYFVFDCDSHLAPDAIPDEACDPATTTAVMTACFYVGYVSRHC